MWDIRSFICVFLPLYVVHVCSFDVSTDFEQRQQYQESVRLVRAWRRLKRDDVAVNVTETQQLHCKQTALTDGFGIITQGVLAVLAFSSLVLKRLREPKEFRRTWTIWFYDTSKQALGAGVIHMVNVFLSTELFQNELSDPCILYIVYFLLDSTFGLFFIYVCVKICQCVVKRCNCKTLYFGEYGTPPKCEAWVGQCGLFVLIIVVEKIIITLFASLKFWSEFAKTLLAPVHNGRVKVVIVMLIIPFILNAVMFWVVDNFLMRKKKDLKEENTNTQVHYYRLENRQKATDSNSGAESEGLLALDEDHCDTVVLTQAGTDRSRVRVVPQL